MAYTHVVLQRVEHENGLVTYQSPLLAGAGVVHAFSTRLGGVSDGPYESLNLAWLGKTKSTDANMSISENFRRLRAAIGCQRMPRAEVRQVHGACVWQVAAKPMLPDQAPQADAIFTDLPARMVTIRTADCVPILLASRDGRVVGGVHAGWRGVVAGVVGAAVSKFHDSLRVPPGNLIGAIGPAISGEQYEVGLEVFEAFEPLDLHEQIFKPSNNPQRYMLDLPRACRLLLQRAGLPAKAIDCTDRCTYRDRDEFFSYRRTCHETPASEENARPRIGQMAAVIAIPAPPPNLNQT